MSETPPAYGPAPPAGYYTLRYADRAPDPPAWLILSARLDAPGLLVIFHLNQAQWLNATEADLARAVPLPEGLVLVYTEPPHG